MKYNETKKSINVSIGKKVGGDKSAIVPTKVTFVRNSSIDSSYSKNLMNKLKTNK